MKTNLLSRDFYQPFEVEIHFKRPLFDSMKSISCSKDVNELLRAYCNSNLLDVKEFFWVILLSRANRVLGISTVSCGHISGVTVNVQEILQLSLLSNASQLIVAHNHPSGKLKPSEIDKRITEKIQKGAALFDTQLLDHLILTSESFYSFADNGAL